MKAGRDKPGMESRDHMSDRRRVAALRMMLASLRASGTWWSDGVRIVEGDRLRDLRRRVIHEIISARAGQRKTASDRTWHNLGVLYRLSRRRWSGSETLGGWLRDMVMRGATLGDPGALARTPLCRRILRRQFPERFAEIPLQLRVPERQIPFMRKAWARVVGETRVAMLVSGITVPEGARGRQFDEGRFIVAGTGQDGERANVLVRRDMMHRIRRQPRRTPAPLPLPAPL